MEQLAVTASPRNRRKTAPAGPWASTGAQVRELRQRLGLTQHDLGVRVGYSGSSANATICKVEHGMICLPTDKLAALARLEGYTSASQLLGAVAEDTERTSLREQTKQEARDVRRTLASAEADDAPILPAGDTGDGAGA